MTVTLVLTQQIADEILDAAMLDVESAGILMARLVETPSGNVRLLARAIHWVSDNAYLERKRQVYEYCLPRLHSCSRCCGI